MSASNNKTGFTVPKGPKEKLTAAEAKKRYEESNAEIDRIIRDLKKTIDDLDKEVS